MGLKLLIVSFVFSTSLLIAGILLLILSTPYLNKYITSQINLAPNGTLYKQWVDPQVPVYMTFYIFDLKNPSEFQNGAQPVLQEIGPFVYREYFNRYNLSDNGDDTLSYYDRKSYVFERNMSQHDENFAITTLNMATVTVYQQIKYAGPNIERIVSFALSSLGENLVTTKTAGQLIWGYEDAFLTNLMKIPIISSYVPTNIIGFFAGQNDSLINFYTIHTGKDDYKKTGIVKEWNKKKSLEFWGDKYSNMINGTDGTVYPALVSKDDPIYIFENDLCRSLYVNYNGTIKVSHHDISVIGFTATQHFFDDYIRNPDNAGFCSPAGNCLPSGLLNLTECQKGIPILSSPPHFLFSPANLSEAVGLSPDFEKHGTILYMEPTSGILMKANKRLQFSTKLEKDPKFGIFAKIESVFFPLFWVDENMEVDKKTADDFYSQIGMPLMLVAVAKWVVFGLGLFCFGLSCLYAYKLRKKIRYCCQKDPNEEKALLYNNQAFDSQNPSMTSVETLDTNQSVNPDFDTSRLDLKQN